MGELDDAANALNDRRRLEVDWMDFDECYGRHHVPWIPTEPPAARLQLVTDILGRVYDADCKLGWILPGPEGLVLCRPGHENFVGIRGPRGSSRSDRRREAERNARMEADGRRVRIFEIQVVEDYDLIMKPVELCVLDDGTVTVGDGSGGVMHPDFPARAADRLRALGRL